MYLRRNGKGKKKMWRRWKMLKKGRGGKVDEIWDGSKEKIRRRREKEKGRWWKMYLSWSGGIVGLIEGGGILIVSSFGVGV